MMTQMHQILNAGLVKKVLKCLISSVMFKVVVYLISFANLEIVGTLKVLEFHS